VSRPVWGEDRTFGGRDLDVSDVEIGALEGSGRERVRLPRNKDTQSLSDFCSGSESPGGSP